jgi:hypothetical protein
VKTLDEKAKETCRKLKLPENGPALSVIRLALKEQDRDTRYTCAKAVLAIPGETGDDLIDAGLAHNACMNACAV